MVVAWLLFPFVLLAICLGCGLLVERIAGWRLPGGLLPSVGLAVVIIVATLATAHEKTAPLTTAAIVVLALAGYATSWPRLRSIRPDWWSVAVGLGVFAVCAAPVVLSGNATWLGYFIDNDAVIHFSLIDQLLTHGHDLRGVPESVYRELVRGYFSTSYPLGADVALGAVRPLVGQNIAWIFQPFQATILALGGVALYELLDGVVSSRPLRSVCAFIAAQPGLVYAYYLSASIKEIATTWSITVTVVLVVVTLRRKVGVRGFVPLVVAAVAGLDLLDLAIVPWIGPPLAVFALVAAWRVRHVVRRMALRRLALATGAAAVVLAALLAPIIGSASTFLSVTSGVLTKQNDLGFLYGPLQGWQALGIWPVGDFRYPVTTHYRIIYALLGVAFISAVLGGLWALRRRAFAPLLLLASSSIAAVYLLSRASPYATAKVLMIFSITVVLISMLGAAALHDYGRRVEAWVLAAVIGGGVLWTNALAYHDAAVAPRDRLVELANIGTRFGGQQPTFYNQSEEFAIHFLRTEGPFDPAFGPPPARPGLVRPPALARAPWDPDDVAQEYLQTFRLLVLGRSPRISRPPADFQLAYEGRYYDVWKRTATPQVLQHIPLGGGLYPSAVPSCRLVMATAARAAREQAQLAYVARPQPPALVPTQAMHPPNWGLVGSDPYTLIPREQPGSVVGNIRVAQPGRYQVWLQGSLSQRFQVWVGGQHVGSVSYELGPPGQFVQIGDVTIGAGDPQVVIVRPGNNLTPGDGGTGWLLGPLMLLKDSTPPAVSEIAPARARALCGQSLDWIEIVR